MPPTRGPTIVEVTADTARYDRPVSSPEDYVAAAYGLMATGDPSLVTIDGLCRTVGTTSGSFYHHFGSLAGFVDALATDWYERSVAAVAKAAVDAASVTEARRLLNDSILGATHQVEAALRAWARTNPTIRDAVVRADEVRLETARTILAAMLPDESEATRALYARIAQLVLIGAQTQRPDEAATLATTTLNAFVRLLERTAETPAPPVATRRPARRS